MSSTKDAPPVKAVSYKRMGQQFVSGGAAGQLACFIYSCNIDYQNNIF